MHASFSLSPFQALSDLQKKFKNSQAQLKEMNGLYEEEQRLREEQHGMTVKAEKKANDLHLEIEELKAQLEQVGDTACTHEPCKQTDR